MMQQQEANERTNIGCTSDGRASARGRTFSLPALRCKARCASISGCTCAGRCGSIYRAGINEDGDCNVLNTLRGGRGLSVVHTRPRYWANARVCSTESHAFLLNTVTILFPANGAHMLVCELESFVHERFPHGPTPHLDHESPVFVRGVEQVESSAVSPTGGRERFRRGVHHELAAHAACVRACLTGGRRGEERYALASICLHSTTD